MGEFTGHLPPIRTRGSRSDKGNGQVILGRKMPQDVEEGRRVVNLSEAFRIFALGLGDQPGVQPCQLLQLGFDRLPLVKRGNLPGNTSADTRLGQHGRRGP